MQLAETKPKNQPTPAQTDLMANDDLAVGPIGFDLAQPQTDKPNDKIALTYHSTANMAETMPAELALIKPSNDSRGVVLGMKLKLSPAGWASPNKLTIPLVILPEGAGIFDPKNSKWVTIEVDLANVYDPEGLV